jgi:uncharacterized protein (TIGR00369 family)
MSDYLSQHDVQKMLDASPYLAFMGILVDTIDPGNDTLVLRLPMRPEFERRPDSGQYHGGVIASLIDTAGDYALAMRIGNIVPTVNFRTDFLRPASHTELKATARVRRIGKTIAVVDIDVHDADHRLIAIGRGTYIPQAG